MACCKNKQRRKERKQRSICRVYVAATMKSIAEQEEMYYDLRDFVLSGTGQANNNFNF